MTLAKKIIQLRKKSHWSQEELAEKIDISRQSVSKWESGQSVPDLNKIIILANIFNVSTDFLLKGDHEDETTSFTATENITKTPKKIQVSLEQAYDYIENKTAKSHLITKGVMLCVCSVVPLFLLLAITRGNMFTLTENIATSIGVVCMLIMVSIAISFFIKSNQYNTDDDPIENVNFELTHEVRTIYHEKLQQFIPNYHRKLSVGIFLIITSWAPLIFSGVFANIFDNSAVITLVMVAVLFILVAAALNIVIPISAKYEALNNILQDVTHESAKSKRKKRAEKLAAFYWPLFTAIYLAWSLSTMEWGVTWIVWPVGALLFTALLGLMELLDKD